MMMQIERASGRVFSYILYVLAAAFGFLLAFITVHGGGSNQLFGSVELGTAVHADAPDPGCDASAPGSADGNGGTGSCAGCGASGGGGSGGSGGTGGGTGSE